MSSKLPQSKPFRAGLLIGTTYIYAKAGDAIQRHVHEVGDNHITIVLNGSFRLFGNPLIEDKILTVGNVAVWPVGEYHGFEALEDGSRMLQIQTGRVA